MGTKDEKRAGNGNKIGKDEYYQRLAPMELELSDVARWLQHTGKRLVVVGSLAVIAAGAFWFVERVFFPGGFV